MGSFFRKGDAGRKASQKHDEKMQKLAEERKNKPREFWMKKGERRTVLFLDDPEFYFCRHSVKTKNGFDNLTCVEDMDIGDCPLCVTSSDKIGGQQYVVACTVLTLDVVEGKDGKKYIYQKQPLVLGGDAKTYLLNMLDKRKSVKLCKVELSRGTGQKSPKVGAFDFEGKISKEGYEKIKAAIVKNQINGDTPIADYLKPFDYELIFKPLTIDELKKIAGTDTASSFGDGEDDFSSAEDLDVETEATDDESPFGDDDETTEREDTTEPDEDNEVEADGTPYDDMSDKEILAAMIEAECPVKKAKAMSREERIAWLVENAGASDDTEENIEDLSDEELEAKLLEAGVSKKKLLRMEREDMIEALKELTEE